MVNMNSIPEEYHNFADVFSKSKAGKLAEHQPYDFKINLDEGTSLHSVPSTPCPMRNLQLCISSLMRTLPLGSSIPHAHPMGPWFSLSVKKTVHYGFAL